MCDGAKFEFCGLYSNSLHYLLLSHAHRRKDMEEEPGKFRRLLWGCELRCKEYAC